MINIAEKSDDAFELDIAAHDYVFTLIALKLQSGEDAPQFEAVD